MDIKNDGKLDKVEETLYSAEKTTQVIKELSERQGLLVDHILYKQRVVEGMQKPRKIKPPVAISMGNYEYIKEKYPDLLDEYDFCVYLSILDLERMVGVNGQT